MPDPNHFDAEKAGSVIALLTAIVAIVTWPFKVFLPRATADRVYLKRIENDGTFQYVRKEDFDRIEASLKENIEHSKATYANVEMYRQDQKKMMEIVNHTDEFFRGLDADGKLEKLKGEIK